jgi:protease secretion system membrane fusion protein
MIKENLNDESGLLPLDASRYLRLGWLIIGIGILGFLIWAAFAPLDKGVVSPGTVVVDGNRKTVQAPTNGIIRQILVTEGEHVKAGQILVQLNQVQVNAQIDSLQQQLATALATQARLLAEQQGLDTLAFPPEMFTAVSQAQQVEAQVDDILALQKQLFQSRREMLKSDLAGMQQSAEGAIVQIKGLREAMANKQRQQASLTEQMKNLRPLTEEGYFPRNRYLELQRNQIELSGSMAEMAGRIGLLEKQQQETQQRMIQRQADYQREVRSQLADIQVQANELKNKLETAQFDLSHTSITAPVEGSIVGLKVFTQGGVVAPGEKLMEILPEQSGLEVEARLMVQLIDKVAIGQDVDLMFTAFNQNRTPKVAGKLLVLSADRLVDDVTRESYYQIRARVTPEGMKKLAGLHIKPGMPVEVFVKTGSRTLLSYLFKPLLDRASTSLIEE